MTVQSHIAALELRHRDLESQLEVELAHSSVDEEAIALLKKQKLEVKDELAKSQISAI